MMNGKLRTYFGAAIVLSTLVGAAQAAQITTGVYDDINNVDAVDVVAVSSNLTLAQLTLDVAAAFAADQGGVVNFETVDGDATTSLVPGDPGKGSYKAIYGVSQNKTLIVSRSEFVVGPPAANGMNQNGTESISGTQSMGLSGSGTYTLTFSSLLKEWAMTANSRGGNRTGILTITHDDNSTYVFAAENPSSDQPSAADRDTLFAYAAPAGKFIKSVNWLGPLANGVPTAGPFLRWDDMAFIVPEPASLSLLSLAGFGLLAARRQR